MTLSLCLARRTCTWPRGTATARWRRSRTRTESTDLVRSCPQDMHLAKRHYDRALEAQPDARVPVQLALASLQVHKWCSSPARLHVWLTGPHQGHPEQCAFACRAAAQQQP